MKINVYFFRIDIIYNRIKLEKFDEKMLFKKKFEEMDDIDLSAIGCNCHSNWLALASIRR